MLAINEKGYFPTTPATNLLQGLKVAIDLLQAEGLDNVFTRHKRAADATRRCVLHWGFEIQCRKPAEYSSSLTAVRLPEGHSADALRADILQRCNLSLGNGLGPLNDRVFRIGHLGDFHDLMVTGTLSGVEMGLSARGVPHRMGGVQAAIASLQGNAGPAAHAAE
jgi:alanine-glyoxylate transaminase/serine-glyoxylate transaminase/serine-pyruvate transaminase